MLSNSSPQQRTSFPFPVWFESVPFIFPMMRILPFFISVNGPAGSGWRWGYAVLEQPHQSPIWSSRKRWTPDGVWTGEGKTDGDSLRGLSRSSDFPPVDPPSGDHIIALTLHFSSSLMGWVSPSDCSACQVEHHPYASWSTIHTHTCSPRGFGVCFCL